MLHEPVAGRILVFIVIGDNYLFTAGAAENQHRFDLPLAGWKYQH
jgi:hypothetical protein